MGGVSPYDFGTGDLDSGLSMLYIYRLIEFVPFLLLNIVEKYTSIAVSAPSREIAKFDK